ncbi:hypothetical protein [Hyalangium rubrum]|uniref:Uncharacterized protein n=1 Tax=Hyalangium rubrum TaxID=3103134 RepID=A0ABU5H1C3_9BACT|nr:hypothetical protein [Hyalangium sp. s54d21]MDY7227255.1 hypothetical protein [Hyalangium sp. s54d21]
MDKLRKPFFIASLVCLALTVLVEVGAPVLLPTQAPDRQALEASIREEGAQDDVDINEVLEVQKENPPTPGLSIPYLALLDALLLLTLSLMGASLLIPERVHGRVQGLVTLIGSIVALLAGIAMLFAAFGLLMLMVSLFLSVPFGTIAYLAVWGFFNRGGASGTLGLLMLLKVVAAVCLVLAHQRFLQNKGLVLLVLTSLLANAIVSFLHGLVPIVLVSITDALGAIIVAILALIWAVVLLIGALVSIVKVLRLTRVAA